MILEGGPHHGKTLTYYAPLPQVLVLVCTTNGFVYSDYRKAWDTPQAGRNLYVWVPS